MSRKTTPETNGEAIGADAQRAMDDLVASGNATSVSLTLSDSSGLHWRGASGVIDAANGAIAPSTLYGVGSTSKMLTTVAIMQLVESGQVSLDQPITRYLPQFTMQSPDFTQVTVRMLLNHTAGFPGTNYSDLFSTAPVQNYAAQVLANLAQNPLKTTPGAMSVYCNDCFTVAGEIVAEVSGLPFTTYVKRNIFQPLGMSNSTFITDELPPEGTVARLVVEGKNAPQEVINDYASGGLFSTPTDMAAFGRMLLNDARQTNGRVLSEDSVGEMGRSQIGSTLIPVEDSFFLFGLGWDSVKSVDFDAVGILAWAKSGRTQHYVSMLYVLPEAGLSAFITGAGESITETELNSIGETILFEALVARGNLTQLPAKIGDAQPSRSTPSSADIEHMVGLYLDSTTSWRVSRGDDVSLKYEHLSGEVLLTELTLTFRDDGWWWPEGPDDRSSAFRPATGWSRNYLVHRHPSAYGNATGQNVLGQRIEPAGRHAPEWDAFLGEWLVVNQSPISSLAWRTGVRSLSTVDGLPGYLRLGGFAPVDAHKPGKATMFLQLPFSGGRDQDELVVISDEYVRLGAMVYQSARSVRALETGVTDITIGIDGYAQWRSVTETRTVSITGSAAWKLYDGDALVAEGSAPASITAPAGSRLVVFAPVGQIVTIGQ